MKQPEEQQGAQLALPQLLRHDSDDNDHRRVEESSTMSTLIVDNNKPRSILKTASTTRRCKNGNEDALSSSSSVSKTDNKKSVSFYSRVKFKHIKHIDDFTDKEYFSTWFVEEDLEEIFNHCVETVRKMVNGCPLYEDEGYCARGLEYKTPTGAKARKENKNRGLNIVLDEQDLQRSLGIYNPDRIARRYYEAGANSRRAYRILAMQDHLAARPILQSKSSIVILREQREQDNNDGDDTEHSSNQNTTKVTDTLNRSATSVVEEFNLSSCELENDHQEQFYSPRKGVRRVRFGTVRNDLPVPLTVS